eukprot:TRINITY_DN2531_c0_g3_i2.p1 TRINITY_DN2531_c0_g3~~TRINITY_DN2531_c0_g3_i2.p1  ORF type:complete len:168 (+),score=1.56 TRINITY_DN2531_c0_g3_i2:17-520(+)
MKTEYEITFIQTGGTIDKDYPKTTKGYAFEISTPAVARILKEANPTVAYNIIPFLQKDSLDITEDDRSKLAQLCKETPSRRIIITHGTDTMIESAKVVGDAISDKVILFLGSKLPERFKDSDAGFNVGVAVGASEFLANGVYIAMNGRVMLAKKVSKPNFFVQSKLT